MTSETNRSKHNTKADDRMNWRYQDKTYNELFSRWRKQTKNVHGFYYAENPNELTYKDGFGFVRNYPEATESDALHHVFNIVGMTIILIVGMDIFYLYALPFIFNKLGADIYMDIFTGAIYGSDWLIIGMYLFFEIVKRLIPFLYCYKKLNMPMKVMVPLKITNKSFFGAAVPSILLAAGVCSALSVLNAKMLSEIGIQPAPWIYLPDKPLPFTASLIANIIIVPAVSEIYIRGPVTQLLRQFGDGFAIIVSAVLTTMITYNINHMCYVFITSVIIGYFSLRTGSVLTGVIMRIVSRAVSVGLYMLHVYISAETSADAIAVMILLITAPSLVFVIRYMLKHSDKLGMSIRPSYLSFSSKCFVALTNIPMVIGITEALIFFIVHFKFEI